MSQSLGDLLRVSSGNAAAQFVSLLAIPVITRLYAPADYGYLGAYVSIVGFLMIFATGRYHLALVVSQDRVERRGLFQLGLLFVSATTLLSIMLVFFAGEMIEGWVGLPGLATLLWFWPLSNLFRGLFLLLQYWCTAHRLFGLLGTSLAAEALIGAVIVIGAGLVLGSSDSWPIAARVLAVCGATLLLTVLIAGRTEKAGAWWNASFDWQELRSLLAKYRRFPLLTSPSALLNAVALAGPPLILAAYFDSAVLAYFVIAERLLSIPLTVVGTSFGLVVYQQVSERFGKASLTVVLQQPLKRLLRIGFFGLGLIAVCGQSLFELALGQDWRQAGFFAQMLVLGAFFRLLAAPFVNVTACFGRQDIELRFNLFLAVGRNAAVVLGAAYYDLTGAILLLSAVSALAYTYLLVRVFQIAETGVLSVFKDMTAELLYQFVLLGGVLFVELYFGGLHTLLAILIGALAWLFLVYRHDREIMQALTRRQASGV